MDSFERLPVELVAAASRMMPTRWKTLLQLLRLLGVLEDERVEETLASDLELDAVGAFIAFYAASLNSGESHC